MERYTPTMKDLASRDVSRLTIREYRTMCAQLLFSSYLKVVPFFIIYFNLNLNVDALCGCSSVRFDSVRFGSRPTSRHSSVVCPRDRHVKHEESREPSSTATSP
ncbi:hypothetical protein Hanom_Chr07g00605731 [Helianthus anomalus]